MPQCFGAATGNLKRQFPMAEQGIHTGSKVARQGLLLTAGFVSAQLLSFIRNACLGYLLSKGDFGIAATLTLTFQTFEVLSDIAVDRMIVQAKDGHSDRLLANAHTVMMARGLLMAGLMLAAAPLLATFFDLAHLTWAFSIIALVPAIKAFTHLDARRQQRDLDNRALMLIEVVPQAVTVAMIVPLLTLTRSFDIILWLVIAQAGTSLFMSHLLARAPYRLAADLDILTRFWHFGLPILLSAIPVFAVYLGDRILVARAYDLETLAGYAAAFLLTMVPGLLASKVGVSLMLPILSQADSAQAPARLMNETITLLSAVYVSSFILAGGHVLSITFGPQYQGLDTVVGLLAIMWALRILQVTPGTMIMASGNTAPLLTAGLLRASALVPATAFAITGSSIHVVVICGIVGEVVAAFYLMSRAAMHGAITSGFLLSLVMAISAALKSTLLPASSWPTAFAAASLGMLVVSTALIAIQPGLRDLVRTYRDHKTQPRPVP